MKPNRPSLCSGLWRPRGAATSLGVMVTSLGVMATHVEEAVVVHVPEHVDGVPGAEGQLSLEGRGGGAGSKEPAALTHGLVEGAVLIGPLSGDWDDISV